MSLPWTDNQGLFGEIESGEHQLWGHGGRWRYWVRKGGRAESARMTPSVEATVCWQRQWEMLEKF